MISAHKPLTFKDIVQSLGLVFGDIGTSPIYTLSVTFAVIPVTITNVIGILSLIIFGHLINIKLPIHLS